MEKKNLFSALHLTLLMMRKEKWVKFERRWQHYQHMIKFTGSYVHNNTATHPKDQCCMDILHVSNTN